MGFFDVTKVEMIMAGPSGEELVNVRHYEQNSSGDLTSAQLALFAISIDATLSPALIAVLSPAVSYVKTILTILTGGSAGFQATSLNNAGAGGGSGGVNGNIERSVIMSLRTAYAGRSERGRLFVPMPAADVADDEGRFNNACTDIASYIVLQAALLQKQSTISANDQLPCIYHRDVQTGQPITSVLISPLIGIQRRRRLGIGS